MDTAKLGIVAIQAALQAGTILKQGFQTAYQVFVKSGLHNLVTQFDKASEDAIIESIKHHFPDHHFLAEESGGEPITDNVLWIIDPLDGTVNFVHHIPMFAISIAAYAEDNLQVGVIYIPVTNELFYAERGSGAYLNGTPIQVSQIRTLPEAMALTGVPSSLENRAEHLQPIRQIVDKQLPVRDLGSAAIHLAYVAAGRTDLFWIPYLYPWDVAAGKLLVEEAGGKVTHYDGTPHTLFAATNLLATNGFLHDEMVPIVRSEEN